MKARIFASLEEAIDEWVGKVSEDAADWPPVYLGPRTAELMAKAAAAVIDACLDSQEAKGE